MKGKIFNETSDLYISEEDLLALAGESGTDVLYQIVLTAMSKVKRYRRIVVAISGGSDSDILMDLFCLLDPRGERVRFVYVNPGLEYKATIEHIHFLEERYGRVVTIIRPKETIPYCCKTYGQPFCNKKVSEYLYRLQMHGFDFAKHGALSFEKLMELYPDTKSALEFWCDKKGEKSMFSIRQNKCLKEFILKYPPYFRISRMCCVKAKEAPMDDYLDETSSDLSVCGVRRSEGGVRAGSYKNCFTAALEGADEYRPLFFMKNADKRIYEEIRSVVHSSCYKEYGLVRTGCCCCPFGRNFEKELAAAQKHEPSLYRAALTVFKDSITYTKMYESYKSTLSVSDELLAEFEQNRATYEERTQPTFRQLSILDVIDDIENLKGGSTCR